MDRDVTIRAYVSADRPHVRRIACETAFLGASREATFGGDEVLADALTLYFTDYEPGSCFVAESRGEVVGYIIGTLDCAVMDKVFNARVLPVILLKAFSRGTFLIFSVWRFLFAVSASFLRGEFNAPDFRVDYPAMLHINIDKGFRGAGLGRRT